MDGTMLSARTVASDNRVFGIDSGDDEAQGLGCQNNEIPK
jgi:hypothetical protein